MGYFEGMNSTSGFDNNITHGFITILYKLDNKVYERDLGDFGILEDEHMNTYLDNAMKSANMDLDTFSMNFVENFNKFSPDKKITVYSLIMYSETSSE